MSLLLQCRWKKKKTTTTNWQSMCGKPHASSCPHNNSMTFLSWHGHTSAGPGVCSSRGVVRSQSLVLFLLEPLNHGIQRTGTIHRLLAHHLVQAWHGEEWTRERVLVSYSCYNNYSHKVEQYRCFIAFVSISILRRWAKGSLHVIILYLREEKKAKGFPQILHSNLYTLSKAFLRARLG